MSGAPTGPGGKREAIRTRHRAIAELREDGVPRREIARRFNCSLGAIDYACLVEGVVLPGAVYGPQRAPGPMDAADGSRRVRRFTAEEDRQILSLSAEGLKPVQIARALGGRKPHVFWIRLLTLARQEAAQELSSEPKAGAAAEAIHG